MRDCWNWQIGSVEVAVFIRACGFKSHVPHQIPFTLSVEAMSFTFIPRFNYPELSNNSLRLCRICSRTPIGRGSRLRTDTVWVRIPPRVPYLILLIRLKSKISVRYYKSLKQPSLIPSDAAEERVITKCVYMPKWRNWQTRPPQKRVLKDVWVRVPLSVPKGISPFLLNDKTGGLTALLFI